MKQTLYTLLLLFLCVDLNAQLDKPVLNDMMTLAQAKYALQVEMATINYYYFQDYYGQRLSDRFRYSKSFGKKTDDFELLPPDTIRQRIAQKNWSASLNHTNREGEGGLWIHHSFWGERINKAKLSTPRSLRNSFVPKKIFYYGSTESDPEILKTDRWYNNRKHIDSMLIDLTIYYPIALKTISISSSVAEKKDYGNGSFLWLISNDGNFMDIAVTEDIINNIASIHAIAEDGTKYDHSRNTYTPQQPSTEMFSYANACYTYCRRLIQNIDDGAYNSIKNLIKEYNETRPLPPSVKWVYRYAFKHRSDLKSIEFTYYTAYDSIVFQRVMAHEMIPRKGDYVIAESVANDRVICGIADKDGQWIIKPNINTSIVDEVAGIFYKIDDVVDNLGERDMFVYVDEKKKQFVKPDFELKKNINDTILIVEKKENYGAVHRSGKLLLPLHFSEIHYQKDWNLFIAKLQSDTPQYQLYSGNGKSVLPKTYAWIEVKGNRLYTTEIKNDIEIVQVYDRQLNVIKEETVIYTIAKPPLAAPECIVQITEELIIGRTDSLTGVFDRAGNPVIPAIYPTLWYDEPTKTITAIATGGQFLLFHTNGKQALPGEYVKITQSNGLIYASEIVNGDEATSVYDESMKQINPKDTWVENEFNVCVEPVLAKDKAGQQFFMSRTGQVVLPHSDRIQYLDGFRCDRALAMLRWCSPTNIVYGYIAPDGSTRIPFIYTKAYSFCGGYAYVEEGDKAMFIDTNNNIYKQLPAKAKNVFLAGRPKDSRYWLANGDVYDGFINLLDGGS